VRRPTASLYLNREFSQLEFNRCVLALATDPRVPALARLRYPIVLLRANPE
jgi:polyphosphate kinase